MATLVELYEEQARACIELAEKKQDEPTIRDALLKIARDWLRRRAPSSRREADRLCVPKTSSV
jgi:hypothetical protein